MACLISNMGHVRVIHKNFTFTSDVFLLHFLLNSVLQRCNKLKLKLKFLEIKNMRWPTLVLRGSQIYKNGNENELLGEKIHLYNFNCLNFTTQPCSKIYMVAFCLKMQALSTFSEDF